MASQKQTEGQLGFEDYKLHQVDVRLKLKEGPAYYSKTPLTTPETAALVMRDIMKDLDREWVSVINMDNHLKPVNFNVVSIGSINSSIAPIQNVLKSTMLSNCNNILLMHNHPSGDVGPSEEDRLLTERLATAAKFMDINLVDHLIVGGQTGDIYSFYAEEPFTLQGRGLDIDYMKKMIRGEDARLAEGKPAYSAQKEEYDPAKAAEARKKEVREITDKLEKGVQDLLAPEKYQRYLDIMAKFPSYSLNNLMLIMLQKPEATLVQSYSGWKKMGRFVKRGEKGIRILAPVTHTSKKAKDKLDKDGKVVIGKDGMPEKELTERTFLSFKPVSTFDVSQTEGDPVPTLGVGELTGAVDGYKNAIEALKRSCPVPITFEDIPGTSKGYFSPDENKIVIRNGMSEVQTVKTLVHEMTHQKLHSPDKDGKTCGKTREQKEVEAESVAYTVCRHFGIDTGDYSFGYIVGWAAGQSENDKLKAVKDSLTTVRSAASGMIREISDSLAKIRREQGIAAPAKPEPSITFSVSECSEFPSLGEYHEGLSLQQALDLYKKIPDGRMNGTKSISFTVHNTGLAADTFDLIKGGRLQQDLAGKLAPSLAIQPLVQKAYKEAREMLAEGHSLTPEEPAMLVREQASVAEPVQEYTTRGNPNPPILKNERRNDGPIMAVKMGCVRLPDLTVTVRTLAICEAAVRIHPEDAKFIPEDVARQMPENIQEMRTEQLSKNHPAVQSRVQAPGSRNAQVIEI